MEITFEQLREKEIINISNGSKLGRIIDLSFDFNSGKISGIVVPGEKKLFKKSDDIFIPIRQIQKIGDDVILIKLNYLTAYENVRQGEKLDYLEGKNIKQKNNISVNNKAKSYIRYRRINNNKYK